VNGGADGVTLVHSDHVTVGKYISGELLTPEQKKKLADAMKARAEELAKKGETREETEESEETPQSPVVGVSWNKSKWMPRLEVGKTTVFLGGNLANQLTAERLVESARVYVNGSVDGVALVHRDQQTLDTYARGGLLTPEQKSELDDAKQALAKKKRVAEKQSPVAGVGWKKDRAKWRVDFRFGGTPVALGLFPSQKEAELVAESARVHLNGGADGVALVHRDKVPRYISGELPWKLLTPEQKTKLKDAKKRVEELAKKGKILPRKKRSTPPASASIAAPASKRQRR